MVDKQLIKRAILMYLTENVSVSPNSYFELNILGKKHLLIEGEESVIPRWVSLILKKRNLVKVKDEVDDVINYALMLISRQSKRDGLEKPNNAIIRLKLRVKEEKQGQYKNNLVAIMKELLEMRLPKVLNKLLATDIEDSDLDPLEKVLYHEMKKLLMEWRNGVFGKGLEEIF